jgi:hypothetical protein
MEIHIHVHHHNHGDEKLFTEIKSINSKLEIMATKQERFDALLTRIDAVTTDLAGDFKTFIEEARTGTISEESFTKAEENVAKLEALAASKENPIPGEEIPQEPTEPTDPNANL